MKVCLHGIGMMAPGLAGWEAARLILQGGVPYHPEPMAQLNVDILPAVERRRCGEAVKLALHVGSEAVDAARVRPETLAAVFTSSSGNGEVLHAICESLAQPQREVSPTRFHNSVHNAPAGYWSIATGSREPSTSLCAYHGSFAAGLLEAALQATCDRRRVLLVACDTVHPAPLHAVCPVSAPFGVGLVLGAAASAPGPRGHGARGRASTAVAGAASHAVLDLSLTSDGALTELAESGLEGLRRGNAAARSLPLLAAIAARRSGTVRLEYLPGQHLAATLVWNGAP